MHPGVVFGCIAAIAVGVAIIMYTVLRTPKDTAKFGNRPSIDLGEVPDEPTEEGAEEIAADDASAEEPVAAEEEPTEN